MKTLLWKELRETARWVPIGFVVASFLVWLSLPGKDVWFKPVAANLVYCYAVAAGAFAVILGIMQSAFDLRPGNRAYLWHRGVTTLQIVFAKWLAALIWQLVAFGIPLVVAAIWMYFHGLQQFPVRPAQVIPALVMALASLALHLAMLVTIARPAAWWGTRLLPLVGPVVLQFLFAIQLAYGGLRGAAIGCVLSCAAIGILLLSAHQVCALLVCDPPACRGNRPRWPLRVVLIGSALGAVPLAMVAIGLAYEQFVGRESVKLSERFYWTYVLDYATSDPWLMQRRIGNDPDEEGHSVSVGYHILRDGKLSYCKAMESTDTRDFQLLAEPNSTGTRSILPTDGFFTKAQAVSIQQKEERSSHVFDHRGHLLVYDSEHLGLVSVIGVDGTDASVGKWGRPFSTNPIIDRWGVFIRQSVSMDGRKVVSSTSRFLMDHHGIYLLQNGQLDALLITEIDRAAFVVQGDKTKSLHLLVLSPDEFCDYLLTDAEGKSDWFASTRDNMPLEMIEIPMEIRAQPVMRVPVTELGLTRKDGLCVASGAKEIVLLRREGMHDRFVRIQPERTTLISSVPVPKDVSVFSPPLFPAGFPPLILLASFVEYTPYSFGERMQVAYWGTPGIFWIWLAMCEVIAIGITVYLARLRRLSWSRTIGWGLATIPLGFAGPLAVIGLYRCPLTEACHACRKARRIDDSQCEHCGSAWQTSAREGIEMTDRLDSMAVNGV